MTETTAKQNFDSGAFIISRSLFESEIWFKPHEYLKIWLYLIGKANHKGRKYGGYFCDRGQYFCDCEELRNQLKYYIGYRKRTYNDSYMKTLVKYLRDSHMITTLKQPRGLLITITNYDSYQNLTNYEKSSGESNERTMEAPEELKGITSINKNYKNEKNDKNSNTIFSEDSDEIRLAGLLYHFLLDRHSGHLKPDIQDWALHIHEMITEDKRDVEDIAFIIEWCQSNDFWKNKVISTEKLRQHFDQLTLRQTDWE